MNPIMEDDQDQEQKKENKQHVCKFCSKSFPCGRSLGGHMRSHVINASSSAEADHHEKLLLAASADSEAGYYGLRENPKKTWRLNSSEEEDTLFLDKFCKECGKGFPSWKSLFGHMKCHSEKERSVSNNNNNNTTNSFFDDQVQDSSWNTNTNDDDDDDDDSCQKLVFDSQSDNEATNNAPNRRKRSKRVRTRYMVAPPPPSTNSSNVSEIEQDEVVAMSLIMLSRDVGNWGGINSVPDNNSNMLNFDAPSSVIEGKRKKNKVLVTNGSDFAAKLTNPKGEKSSEILSASTNHSKYTSIKAKFLDSEAEFSKISHQNKRGKFECTTCNKIFHSYQALGGHRASHKKIKGCFASRNYEGSENSIEFEEPDPSSIITDPTTTTAQTSNNKHIMKNKKKNSDNNNSEFYHLEQHHEEEEEEVVVETESKNKGKGFHECPICLKVFTSGQALGGHKRSHMSNNGGSIEGGKKCQSQRVVLHESVPEIRDFLDLNLPADDDAAEEEISNNSSHVDVNYRPWWVVGGGNHKQEALVGLISN